MWAAALLCVLARLQPSLAPTYCKAVVDDTNCPGNDIKFVGPGENSSNIITPVTVDQCCQLCHERKAEPLCTHWTFGSNIKCKRDGDLGCCWLKRGSSSPPPLPLAPPRLRNGIGLRTFSLGPLLASLQTDWQAFRFWAALPH
jgi:hypothetical protein